MFKSFEEMLNIIENEFDITSLNINKLYKILNMLDNIYYDKLNYDKLNCDKFNYDELEHIEYVEQIKSIDEKYGLKYFIAILSVYLLKTNPTLNKSKNHLFKYISNNISLNDELSKIYDNICNGINKFNRNQYVYNIFPIIETCFDNSRYLFLKLLNNTLKTIKNTQNFQNNSDIQIYIKPHLPVISITTTVDSINEKSYIDIDDDIPILYHHQFKNNFTLKFNEIIKTYKYNPETNLFYKELATGEQHYIKNDKKKIYILHKYKMDKIHRNAIYKKISINPLPKTDIDNYTYYVNCGTLQLDSNENLTHYNTFKINLINVGTVQYPINYLIKQNTKYLISCILVSELFNNIINIYPDITIYKIK